MRKLPVSVIIIAKNAEETMADCLESVQRNNPAEIIVVDGNSGDRTVKIARKYTDRLYCDEGKGRAYARQLGVEQASQEYIVYIDSDVIVNNGALATMLAEFQSSGYVSLRAQLSPGTKRLNYWERAQHEHNQLRHVEDRIGMLACVFRKETILKYGFDLSSEGALDDVDLELRLKRDGHKFGTSSALVCHQYIRNVKNLASYRFFLGRMTARYIKKYGPWHAGLWPPLATLYWLALCLIKGKPKLIPYFVVNGIVMTAGIVKGFFELIQESLKKVDLNRQSLYPRAQSHREHMVRVV